MTKKVKANASALNKEGEKLNALNPPLTDAEIEIITARAHDNWDSWSHNQAASDVFRLIDTVRQERARNKIRFTELIDDDLNHIKDPFKRGTIPCKIVYENGVPTKIILDRSARTGKEEDGDE